MLAYSIDKAISVFSRADPSVSKTTLIRSQTDDEPFRPQDYGFDFSFGLTSDMPASIGYFTLNRIFRYLDENNKSVKDP
jgi:hypothetical protein